MNWKFVAALMVGAVMALGCASTQDSSTTPTSTSRAPEDMDSPQPGAQPASTKDPSNGVIVPEATKPKSSEGAK